MAAHPNSHFESLREWFDQCGFALVAFSGGVDSSLVSYLANRFLGSDRNLSIISDSPSLKRSELEQAKNFCGRHAIRLQIIQTQELADPRYASNPSNRCFYCKHALYNALQQVAQSRPGCWILNGTNVDDLGDYRPGLQAADAFQVRSPLAECGLNKSAVRELAESLELECWNKPASPCLSSRIAYGQAVTVHKLRQIEAAEAMLQAAGFDVVRLRHYGSEARIEVPTADLPRLLERFPAIQPALLDLGLERVTVDEEGFVSGKLNRSLTSPVIDLPIL